MGGVEVAVTGSHRKMRGLDLDLLRFCHSIAEVRERAVNDPGLEEFLGDIADDRAHRDTLTRFVLGEKWRGKKRQTERRREREVFHSVPPWVGFSGWTVSPV